MAKSAKKLAAARRQKPNSGSRSLPAGNMHRSTAQVTSAAAPPKPATTPSGSSADPDNAGSDTKQSRVLALLRSPDGATIASMMQATGWQQHSVRGFLAGVVRKRLKLRLTSKKLDGTRVYQIADTGGARAKARESKRRAS